MAVSEVVPQFKHERGLKPLGAVGIKSEAHRHPVGLHELRPVRDL